ncbi:murein transglycosylase domain-containing protein [Vibrio sp. CAU 1672]|uniref:murein transglycosylase domain-containing protein n=1 Tax=Vibrio sp. CAU 1672 TaxID=3032594 RepID=UPI0023DA3CD1|nr:murein transglycosylase domain-containing protein [Vibrio sp. CAU 1672]MDF2155759.1 murein transglycosylase domain-containing protein [Vibrio sp. CAU 1672]
MKNTILRLSPLALLFSSFSYAETLQQACELEVDANQCPSVNHFVSQPFEAQDDFEKYKLCSEAKYDLYKVQKNCEFDQYLANAQKAFDQFKNKVSKKWDKPNFSDQYSWVSYSPSLELKREVNFEKNVIKVTTIAGEETTIEELKEEILATSELTIGEAQKADVYTAALIEETNVETLSPQTLLPVAENNAVHKQELKEALDNVVITESVDSKGNTVIEAQVSFPPTWLNRKEKRFFDTVETYANKYDLEPEFVLSIIKTESAFDPTAVSHIPAFGLMQVVPSSAGLDATSFLFGERQLLNRDYLFDPEKNIEVGTAYIHLLRSRYFKGIENEESLKYCVIAAYNGGMGPIYQMFGGKRSVAIKYINQLSPEKVFSTIQKKHSAAETRNYLKKVHSAELNYEKNMI